EQARLNNQNPAASSGQSGSPPKLNSQDQVTLNQLQNNLIAPTPPVSQPLVITQPNCPQCGLIHPPLAEGKVCSNANDQIKDGDKKQIDVNKYLVIWRDIVITNVSKKEIKDSEKLFQQITVEISKFMEGYKE
ncbi:MAG: hypothetical protein ACTSWJ_05550, partial [Candidatus Heimdallarchaeaceae archaeon]